MSTGSGSAVGAPPGPVPLRQGALDRLRRELGHARDVGETAYAARLEADIARLSQGTKANPRVEQAASRRPAATKRKAR